MKILYKSEHNTPPDKKTIARTIDLLCHEMKTQHYDVENFGGGQTNALKTVITIADRKFFIKTGEKVMQEKVIYAKKPFAGNQLFLAPLNLPNLPEDALILPFYKGIQLDDFIFCPKNRIDTIYNKLDAILNSTAENLWLPSINSNSDNIADWTSAYVEPRIRFLSQRITFECENKRVAFSDLIKYQIKYSCPSGTFELPPMDIMIKEIIDLFEKYNPPFTSTIIGDFQPTNILLQGNDFKIVDLSNSEMTGDIALDIGKTFNFTDRFFRIALIRDKKEKKSNAIDARIELVNNKLSFFFRPKIDFVFQRLLSQLEEKFTRLLAIKIKDYHLPDRVKLFKFIVNVITLKRHIINPQLTELLLINIADSYMEIRKKVKAI